MFEGLREVIFLAHVKVVCLYSHCSSVLGVAVLDPTYRMG